MKTSEATPEAQGQPGYAPTIVTFGVSDPEVLAALAEYDEGPARAHFLATCLKVGVLSLKAARGTLDSGTLQREGDRLMEVLGASSTNGVGSLRLASPARWPNTWIPRAEAFPSASTD